MKFQKVVEEDGEDSEEVIDCQGVAAECETCAKNKGDYKKSPCWKEKEQSPPKMEKKNPARARVNPFSKRSKRR